MLVYSDATPGDKVELKVKGVASQPFLNIFEKTDTDKQITDFKTAHEANKFDWLDMRIGTVEIHAQADKTRDAIDNRYDRDVKRYATEISDLFVGDAYRLAGFVMHGESMANSIAEACKTFDWDCENQMLHKAPDTQHINIDTYAQCGSACGGNFYDQTWGLRPRG
ncbi:hypothetical protein AAF463_24650 (plasmid) [Pantoea sp. BJ2]|uniref:Peptidase M60 domain-containing protein n=1 Tax=Pantoea sp. BJ2 TaxID=3141322 RepID=A0AAU7U3B2_9GAMM